MPLDEPLKLFFNLKESSKSCEKSLLTESHLTLARRAETIYSTYIDFVRWVMDLLWEMGLFCSWNRKEFIGFYWTVIEFIWVRAEANEIFFFFFIF